MERKTTGIGAIERSGLPKDGTSVDAHRILADLPGRTPEEVLADIGQISLGRNIGLAVFVCMVAMALLTVGPFLLAPPKPAVAAAKSAAPTPAEPQPQATAPAAAPADGQPQPAGAAPRATAEAVKKLGVDEVKQSDPKNNPLDGDVDDLLKDLK